MQVAPKSVNLRHHRAESVFSTSSWIDAGGSEISEFVPSPSEISVFELGGCENCENARTVDDFEPGNAL